MKKYFSFLFLFILIFSCNKKTTSTTTSNNSSTLYKVSKVYEKYEQLAPRLEPDYDDNTIYIVNFWATWCSQCLKEIPEMVRLEKKYRANKNIKILFVNLDDSSTQKRVNPFLKKHNIQGEVVALTDPNQDKWIRLVDYKWRGSLPGTLFIKGVNRKFYAYPLSYNELELNIEFMKNK